MRAAAGLIWIVAWSLALHALDVRADDLVTETPSPYVAPEGRALVVFIRERLYAKATRFRVLDDDTRCVSVIKGERHVLLPVVPGTHRLYLLVAGTKDQAEALQLEVEAGKTYVVDIRAQWRRKDYMDINTVRPGTDRAEQAAKDIRNTDLYEPDLERCAEWVEKKRDEIGRKIAFAKEQWADGGEPYQRAHSLKAHEGFPPEQAQRWGH